MTAGPAILLPVKKLQQAAAKYQVRMKTQEQIPFSFSQQCLQPNFSKLLHCELLAKTW